MRDYTTLNYTNGAIIHDPTDQDTKSFSEHINNEVIITTAYCDIEHSDTDNKILCHVTLATNNRLLGILFKAIMKLARY